MVLIEYKCIICVKYYKTYQTLWNHTKKFHTPSIPTNNPIVIHSIPNVVQNNNYVVHAFLCKFCGNNYSNRQNKWKHEQKCKIKYNTKQTISLIILDISNKTLTLNPKP